jgi:hypothetical protein
LTSFTDTFTGNTTGANLTTSSSGQIGSTPLATAWQLGTGTCPVFFATSGEVRAASSSFALCATEASPASADYTVSANFVFGTYDAATITSNQVAIIARSNLAGSSGYFLFVTGNDAISALLGLYSLSSASFVDGPHTVTVAASNSYAASLTVTGNSLTYSFNGTNYGPFTNSDVSSAGLASLAITGGVGVPADGKNWSIGGTYTQTNVTVFGAGTLSATVASSTSIALSTTSAVGGSSPYNYQFQSSPDNSTWSNIGPNSSSTTYTATSLTTRTNYYFRCINTDSASHSASSNVVEIFPAVATTYYIAASGNDSNNGTTGTPWATASKVSGWNQYAGDQYLFNKGDTFTGGGIAITGQGTQSAFITVSAYGSGANPIIQVNSDTYGLQIKDCSYILAEHLKLVGLGYSGTPPNITTSGTWPGIQIFSSQQGASYLSSIYLNDIDVGNFYSGLVVVTRTISGSAGGGGSPFYLKNGSIASAQTVGINDIRITNCQVHDALANGLIFIGGYGSADTVGWAQVKTTFNGVYVADCLVYNIFGMPGQSAGAPNVVLFSNTTGFLMERCTIYNNGAYAGASTGGHISSNGPGAIVCGEATKGVIQYCEVYNTFVNGSAYDGTAIDFDDNCTYCIAQSNFTHDNAGGGLVGGVDSSGNNTYRYNISYNDCNTNYGSIYMFGGANNTFHNNTIYLNGSSITDSTGQGAIRMGSGTATFYNNVIITTGSIPLVNGTLSGCTFNGNLYYASGGTVSIGGHTFAAWQGTGQDANGQYGNPNLVGPLGSTAFTPVTPAKVLGSMTNLNLQSTSPAIGSALNLLQLDIQQGPIDFHEYPSSVFDVGACSYSTQSLLANNGTGGSGNSVFCPNVLGV